MITDMPVSKFEEDLLGRKEQAKAISNYILGMETPITIGIHGDWGSGKTSFVNLVEAYLGERKDLGISSKSKTRNRAGEEVSIKTYYGKIGNREQISYVFNFDSWVFGSTKDIELAFLAFFLSSAEKLIECLDISSAKKEEARRVISMLKKGIKTLARSTLSISSLVLGATGIPIVPALMERLVSEGLLSEEETQTVFGGGHRRGR